MKKHKLVIQRRSAFNAIIILIIVASFFIVLSQICGAILPKSQSIAYADEETTLIDENDQSVVMLGESNIQY